MNTEVKGRVLVAMSGGIDSSVAAVLLHEQGYEVVGMTMKTWDYASAGGSKKETGCCSLDSINDARDIAVRLGFPHYIIDIRDDFVALLVQQHGGHAAIDAAAHRDEDPAFGFGIHSDLQFTQSLNGSGRQAQR